MKADQVIHLSREDCQFLRQLLADHKNDAEDRRERVKGYCGLTKAALKWDAEARKARLLLDVIPV